MDDKCDEETGGLENPIKILILSSVLQCEFCDFVFSNVDALLLHEGTHDPCQGYNCSMCNIHVCTIKEIAIHWQTECPFKRYESATRNTGLQTYFVCNVCENKFNSLAQLYEHRYSMFHLFPRKNSTDELRIGCEICGNIFETAKAIIQHHSEHKSKKSIKKESGHSATTTVGGGIISGSSASKYRQYLCDVCGKSYTQSSHLWQHLRFHKGTILYLYVVHCAVYIKIVFVLGVKPFACKEPNCTRKFTIRPDLNDHIRKCHTGERPYHCQICGKRFLTGSVFYQHRLIHRGERRYGCDECGKRFYRADALKNHQRIHTGEKPYACTQCPKNFRQRGDRDKHIRARHSGLIAAKENMKLAAEAAATAVSTSVLGKRFPPGGRIRCKKDLLMRRPPPQIDNMNYMSNSFNGSRGRRPIVPSQHDDVVYVGNIAFPSSMFRPICTDIDAIGKVPPNYY